MNSTLEIKFNGSDDSNSTLNTGLLNFTPWLPGNEERFLSTDLALEFTEESNINVTTFDQNLTRNSSLRTNFTRNSSFNLNTNCSEVAEVALDENVVLIVVNSIVSLLIISGNIVTIAAVLKTPVLGNVSNMFLVSLTFADILVGFLASPLQILTDIPYFKNLLNTHEFFCMLQHVCLTIPTRASLTSLTVIAVDRAIYIGSDKIFDKWIQGLKAPTIVVFIWSLSISTGCVPFVYNNWQTCKNCDRKDVLELDFHNNFETIYLLLCTSIMVISFIFCYAFSYYQMRHMAEEERKKRELDLNFIKSFVLVFLFTLLCYIPGFLVSVLTNLEIEVPSYVDDINNVSAQVNSSMNFIFYVVNNRKFRLAFMRILCPKKFMELDIGTKIQLNIVSSLPPNIRSKIKSSTSMFYPKNGEKTGVLENRSDLKSTVVTGSYRKQSKADIENYSPLQCVQVEGGQSENILVDESEFLDEPKNENDVIVTKNDIKQDREKESQGSVHSIINNSNKIWSRVRSLMESEGVMKPARPDSQSSLTNLVNVEEDNRSTSGYDNLAMNYDSDSNVDDKTSTTNSKLWMMNL